MQPQRLSSCEEYKRNISALMDNALPNQDKKSLMQHTQSCAYCFSELEAQKQAHNIVRSNIHFLAKSPMSQSEGSTMASTIMTRIAQQDKAMDDYRKYPANHKHFGNPNTNPDATKNSAGDSRHNPKYEFLFNPRPLIITSAASLLILVGSSTSMLYSFSSVQHESLSDGSLVIMVSDIDIEK